MRTRRGANAVEFALLLPVFVMLCAGTVELGWLLFQHGVARSALTDGCREGTLLDPGPLESDLEGVLARTREAIQRHHAASGGVCDACVISVEPRGQVPMRSLWCQLRVPRVSLTQVLPGTVQTVTQEVVLRMEHQRRMQ